MERKLKKEKEKAKPKKKKREHQRVEQLLAQVVLAIIKKESCETSKRRVGPKR
jgi:hypothetical protein